MFSFNYPLLSIYKHISHCFDTFLIVLNIKLYVIYWKTYVEMSVLRENEWKMLSTGTASAPRSPFASAPSSTHPSL